MTGASGPSPLRLRTDVVIVGGGVAGLAAAGALTAGGMQVVVLEGRDRLGGRVLTHRAPGLSVPIELGAEFLHGSAERTEELVRDGQLTALDVGGERWASFGGGLRPLPDFWERLDRVMRRLSADRKHDRSFAAFLAAKPGGARLVRERRLAAQFVRGFHAADPELASEQALADGGSPRGDKAEERIARLAEGYSSLVAVLASRTSAELRLATVVTQVSWSAHGVRVDALDGRGEPLTVEAYAAIVTVPVGVLQAASGTPAAIAFDPPLPDATRRQLARMPMGHVTRATLVLDEPAWALRPAGMKDADAALRRLSFLHADDGAMPVCWTMYPAEAPAVVAWFGGPEGGALSGRADVEERVVDAVAARLKLRPASFRRHVRSVHHHDWSADPFSRGAYSYVAVDGRDASASLARPIGERLHLAGEAVAPQGQNGTVEGAIASGEAAARRILRG